VVTIEGWRIIFDASAKTGAVRSGGVHAGKRRRAALQRTLHEDIKPYPKDGVTIAPGDYRATVVVVRQ
jgi:hypothetical protein